VLRGGEMAVILMQTDPEVVMVATREDSARVI